MVMSAPSPVPTPDLVLEMRGVSKRFPGVVALNNVDFDGRRGEIHALVAKMARAKAH